MKIYNPQTGEDHELILDEENKVAWALAASKELRNMATLERTWYALGAALKPIVNQYIDGRFTMQAVDAGALMRAVATSPGDYLEIGSLHGGSAIIAGIAQKITGKGIVQCVDPFGWFSGQSRRGPEPSPEVVIQNAMKFGVGEVVFPYEQRHPPLPDNLEGKMWGTIFIDGDHSYEGVKADWDNLHHRALRYVLLHDYNLKKHGVGVLLNEIQEGQHGGEQWHLVYAKGKMAVLERIGWNDGETGDPTIGN